MFQKSFKPVYYPCSLSQSSPTIKQRCDESSDVVTRSPYLGGGVAHPPGICISAALRPIQPKKRTTTPSDATLYNNGTTRVNHIITGVSRNNREWAGCLHDSPRPLPRPLQRRGRLLEQGGRMFPSLFVMCRSIWRSLNPHIDVLILQTNPSQTNKLSFIGQSARVPQVSIMEVE